MRFILKDYQEDAVRDVLANLRRAHTGWREDGEKTAFSLTAPTGAGKTVMAAAVFEALFCGDDYYRFDADPGAVVLWFSDDPSLNEQSCFRLWQSSDRIPFQNFEIIKEPFVRERFNTRTIYFLNTQKLGKNSILVRGFDEYDEGGLFPETRPDMQWYTLWDTIKNTIEAPGARCIWSWTKRIVAWVHRRTLRKKKNPHWSSA